MGTYPEVFNESFGSLSGSGPLWWGYRWGWGEAVQLVLGCCLLLVAGNEKSQRLQFFFNYFQSQRRFPPAEFNFVCFGVSK